MKYSIFIERDALKALRKIPKKDQLRVADAIELLSENQRPIGSRKLSGREGWRIRIGDYRVIYEIEDDICHILVLDIGHRKDIYR